MQKTMKAIELEFPHNGLFDCWYRNTWLNEYVDGRFGSAIGRSKIVEFARNQGFTHIRYCFSGDLHKQKEQLFKIP